MFFGSVSCLLEALTAFENNMPTATTSVAVMASLAVNLRRTYQECGELKASKFCGYSHNYDEQKISFVFLIFFRLRIFLYLCSSLILPGAVLCLQIK